MNFSYFHAIYTIPGNFGDAHSYVWVNEELDLTLNLQ